MDGGKKLIDENDTVYDVVTKYPGIRARLLEMSDKYKRLDNPVVFHTVARMTTLKKAADVGGIYWKEFLYQLNDAIGLGREFLEKSKTDAFTAHGRTAGPSAGTAMAERPSWMEGAGSFGVMDVREGGEPFEAVTSRAKALTSGQGFVLVQVFEPQPLIGYLATLGFEHFTEKKGDAEFRVYFYKK